MIYQSPAPLCLPKGHCCAKLCRTCYNLLPASRASTASLSKRSEESHVLSPSEVKKVHPLLRVDDIYGGVYSPGDGTIDPTSICNAYAKAAKKYGGGVYENVAAAWAEIIEILLIDDNLY